MPRYTMPPINLGSPPADYAWYTPSTQQSMHSTHPAVYAADTGSGLCTYSGCHQTTHTCTQSNHITSSLYNSTILHTKTTRQRHIYVKKTVGEWWGMWGGGKWGWMFARETLSSDWRTLSKKLWATLLCHTTRRRRRSSVVLSQQPNIAHMHTK